MRIEDLGFGVKGLPPPALSPLSSLALVESRALSGARRDAAISEPRAESERSAEEGMGKEGGRVADGGGEGREPLPTRERECSGFRVSGVGLRI